MENKAVYEWLSAIQPDAILFQVWDRKVLSHTQNSMLYTAEATYILYSTPSGRTC